MTEAIPGNLTTTAMAVMPHTDPARALEDRFFAQVGHPRGIHLCGNPDREFTMERVFQTVKRIVQVLREKYL